MDFATHFLVPYAGALAAYGFWRKGAAHEDRAALALVFGLAGFAPDLDGLVDPLSARVDALWWLQHRGVSHTLVGAPLYALAFAGLLGLAARRFPRRLALLRWRAAFVPAAVLGSFTHLLLDSVTYAGVPLLWPFAFGRWGWPLFHWLVIWLLPVGLLVAALHALGRLSRRGIVAAGAAFVAALVVVAGGRYAAMPEAPEGGFVFPRASAREWTVLQPVEEGWLAWLERGGERHDARLFRHHVPPEAEAAVALARDTAAWRGFHLGSFGPVVVEARPQPDGWHVNFTDVAQRFEALHDPRWTPVEPHDAWGYVAFVVAEEAVAVHRGW